MKDGYAILAAGLVSSCVNSHHVSPQMVDAIPSNDVEAIDCRMVKMGVLCL